MSSACIHVVKAAGELTSEELGYLVVNATCDTCRVSAVHSNVWLCIFPDCYERGCTTVRPAEKEDHSTQHYIENPHHCLQLNICNWRTWCYKCNAEVFLSRNKPAVRGSLGKPKLGRPQVNTPESKELENHMNTGLTGLCNLGNTCYMNAALQCLSNVPALRNQLMLCPDLIPRDVKPNLSFAFRNLMMRMWDQSCPNYVEPSAVLTAMKTVFPAFRGFQQHDSQEFLRCFLDQLHKEMSEPIMILEQDNQDDMDDAKTETSSDNIESLSEVESGASDQCDEYETASDNSERGRRNSSRKRRHKDDHDKLDQDSGLGSYSGCISNATTAENKSSSASIRTPASPTSLSDHEYLDAASDPGSGSQSPIISINPDQLEIRHHKPRTYRSVVTDVFDGKLVSSVKCLSCDRVSKTTETFQDLSLPIPSQEALSNISDHAGSLSSDNNEGWIFWMWKWFSSWFYGPDVTLQDCLSFFFSEDELKGDNMYSCDKCKKLRNGLKYSKVTQLPDTLCIHLKRFRHDFAFSSKISTRVTFPLTGLDLSPWVHKDCVSKQVIYNLTGIICHHGTAGGGHYTSYCYNSYNECWYHFDDSIVTEVDPSVVASAEAYVLFYRKDGAHLDDVREQVEMALQEANQEANQSLVKYYLSLPWWVKFSYMAEPGQIDNSSVLCVHGGILPHRLQIADRLCTVIPPAAWNIIYERFGNYSESVTSLKPCQTCLRSARMEERQKQFERSEFQLLHEQDGAGTCEESSPESFLLVRSWYTAWEEWVMGRAREPPGPINNRSLYTQRGNNSHILRPNIDRLKISEDIWTFFLSLYSGGPEVVLRPGGGIKVSTPRLARIQSIAARLQARCRETMRISECSA